MSKVKEYFASKRISNSFLGMLSNPRWMKLKMDNPDMEDDEKKYFRIGSALDTLLTDNDEFHNQFKIVETYRPFGLMGKFVENLPLGLTKESPVELYQEAYENSGYKMKIERVWENFWANKEAVEYYDSLCCEEDDRMILSKDEFDTVINMKELVLSNEFTHKYFFTLDKQTIIYSQTPIYFDYKDLECKALLDGIKINHKDKTIQPYDLKTTGKSIYEFEEWIYLYGYHRQAAFYMLALKEWIKSESNTLKALIGNGLDDYTILPFKFIVVESKLSTTTPAIIYELSNHDLDCGLHGGIPIGSKRFVKGIDQLIEDYKWHKATNRWNLRRELYESDGIKITDIFKKLNESI